MLRELGAGAAIAVRRWRHTLGITVLAVAVCAGLSAVLGEVFGAAGTLRAGAALRAADATDFAAFYPPGAPSDTPDEALTLLHTHLREGRAYAAVVYNLGVDDPELLGGTRTLAVVGAAAAQIFPDIAGACAAPCALRGSALPPPAADALRLRGITAPYAGTLHAGANWFDTNAGEIALDSAQVLLITPEQLRHLDDHEREELLTRTVLLGQSQAEVERFVAAVAPGGLLLVPGQLAVEQPRRFAELMTRAALLLLAVAAFAAAAGIAYAGAVREILRAERQALAIRRACGAPPGRLAVRLVSFLACATAVVPLALCAALSTLGPALAAGARVTAAAVLAVYAISAALGVRAVRRITAAPGVAA